MKLCVETWTLMSYRPVTYKKFSGSYEMLKQLLPSVLLKTEGLQISITRRNRMECTNGFGCTKQNRLRV